MNYTRVGVMVEQLRRDFHDVTTAWLETGVADAEDVEHMRAVIAQQTRSGAPPTPEIDDRSRAARIEAWGRTWRELAIDTPRAWHSAGYGGVLLRDMVVEVKRDGVGT